MQLSAPALGKTLRALDDEDRFVVDSVGFAVGPKHFILPHGVIEHRIADVAGRVAVMIAQHGFEQPPREHVPAS